MADKSKGNFFGELKEYFRKIKKTPDSLKEIAEVRKQTKNYLFICLGALLAFAIISCIPVIKDIGIITGVFAVIGFVGLIGAAYFGLNLYLIKAAEKRLKNLSCDKCGEKLGNLQTDSWKVIREYWRDGASNEKGASSKHYTDFSFTCVCPKCNTEKTFTATLNTGKIIVDNAGSRKEMIPVEEAAENYLTGGKVFI